MSDASLTASPLSSGLLKAVSRSFYLSLRVLPKAVRPALSLSYLLARAADTIADEGQQPTAVRQGLLQQLLAAVTTGTDSDLEAKAAHFALAVSHPGEATLLRRLGECLGALRALSPKEQGYLSELMHHLTRGMSEDLARAPTPDRPMVALPDAAALEEYTWLVAGCVGRFWTQICLHHDPRFSRTSPEQMTAWGESYGCGLQLVNVLRDLPKDLGMGRCYLPGADAFAFDFTQSEKWHDLRTPWIAAARERLSDGERYVQNLRGFRHRFAAVLPLLMGRATLDLIATQPRSQMPQLAKITRAETRRLMRRAVKIALFS
jgi:farnesyl-diphosphate farnesyltransferase